MKKAFISNIEYYLPDNLITNEFLSHKFPEWSPEKITSKTGVTKRFKSKKNEVSSDLAYKAAKKLIDNNSIDSSKIDFLILCTQSPDYFLPTTACILQDRLNLPTNCGAFDFNLGCSGYVYGLAICKGLIQSGVAKNILLITSEIYSKYIHDNDKGNQTIFSDGASASLISINGFAEILNFDFGTDGSGYEKLIVKEGGLKNRIFSDDFSIDSKGRISTESYLYMNGPEIFSFTSRMVPSLVENTLIKNNLEFSDINLFIFHQASKFVLDHIRKKIKIPDEKFFLNIENIGNTVSSTIPIALKNAMEKNKCKGKILLAGFGVGLSWGGTILNFK